MKRKLTFRKSNLIAKIFALIFPSIILTGCPAMYGAPHASYSASGSVTDEAGKRLKGIQVSVGGHYYTDSLGQEQIHFSDSTLTNLQGEYHIDLTYDHLMEMIVVAEDIDGEKGGGEYQSDTLVIKDFKYKGGSTWYLGRADVKGVNFRLKKK
ncbi:MAG: hypothetical protein GX993_00955 [Bacteroidales bacterium]|nr:hypothetical protein [Bacteroidales bacterium]